MNANVPEKIYLTSDEKKSYVFTQKRSDGKGVEYVRTDAFIKKACDWLKENKDKYLYNTGGRDEYIPTCSSKIIDDFRNYMERK